MLAWSVDALVRAESIGPIVIAAPPGGEGLVREAASAAQIGAKPTLTVNFAPIDVVAGGETRAESVRAALEHVDTDLVVIQDAARPAITPSLVDSVVGKLIDHPEAAGVIAAAPLTDTVKRARDLEIARTESREHLWAAQTPQAFRTAKLREAYAADPPSVAAATDEAMLVEKAGGKVLIEPAPALNLKVTTPEDLRAAELLLAQGV
jgi:2-C-methyl-D-erythritol 4-phosphate cytidylyltransferase